MAASRIGYCVLRGLERRREFCWRTPSSPCCFSSVSSAPCLPLFITLPCACLSVDPCPWSVLSWTLRFEKEPRWSAMWHSLCTRQWIWGRKEEKRAGGNGWSLGKAPCHKLEVFIGPGRGIRGERRGPCGPEAMGASEGRHSLVSIPDSAGSRRMH